jgi:hypothetical protein
MLGVDSKGMEIEAVISKDNYKKLMLQTLHESQSLANTQKNINANGFFLYRVSIGVGGDAEIGIGPFKIGGGIHQRFYFERLNE